MQPPCLLLRLKEHVQVQLLELAWRSFVAHMFCDLVLMFCLLVFAGRLVGESPLFPVYLNLRGGQGLAIGASQMKSA